MKKTLLSLAMAATLFACAPEQQEVENTVNIDFTQIVNPDTVRALQALDTSVYGIYRGVFVAEDGSNHGIITVNAGNDKKFNAVLQIPDEGRVGFIGSVDTTNRNIINFTSNRRTSFTLDISDSESPLFKDGLINGLQAQATLIKEHANNRVVANLGTFVDNADSSFSGTWDFISTSTRVIDISAMGITQSVTVNNIDTVVVCRDGGVMFTDTTLEDITPSSGCVAQGFPAGTQQPFFSGAQTINVVVNPFITVPVDIDEYFLPLQTSSFAGATASWSLIFSKANNDTYYNNDCDNEFPQLSGSFSYSGRIGSIFVQ